MESALTIGKDPEDGRDYFMLVASAQEWEAVMSDLDGVGHSIATLKLLSELKRWGLRTTVQECPFDFAHTRHWCGYDQCRDS